MYSSDRQRLCRASLIRNKLTERLVETIQRFHLHSFTLVSHSLETFRRNFTIRKVSLPSPVFQLEIKIKGGFSR